MPQSLTARSPWFLWPFTLIWDLLALILTLTGRLLGAVIGLVLMIVGGVLIILVVTIPVGIPLAALGFGLMVRSLA